VALIVGLQETVLIKAHVRVKVLVVLGKLLIATEQITPIKVHAKVKDLILAVVALGIHLHVQVKQTSLVVMRWMDAHGTFRHATFTI
jgi:hypothetical protein